MLTQMHENEDTGKGNEVSAISYFLALVSQDGWTALLFTLSSSNSTHHRRVCWGCKCRQTLKTNTTHGLQTRHMSFWLFYWIIFQTASVSKYITSLFWNYSEQ